VQHTRAWCVAAMVMCVSMRCILILHVVAHVPDHDFRLCILIAFAHILALWRMRMNCCLLQSWHSRRTSR
jgi:hypothetical protein